MSAVSDLRDGVLTLLSQLQPSHELATASAALIAEICLARSIIAYSHLQLGAQRARELAALARPRLTKPWLEAS